MYKTIHSIEGGLRTMRILERKKTNENSVIYLIEFGSNEKLHVENSEHLDLSYSYKKRGYNRGSGAEYITFSQKIYILVKNYNFQTRTCDEIYHARECVENMTPRIREAQIDPKLQATISIQCIKPLSYSQFQYLVLFDDEIAIGRFEKTGKSGWIVKVSDLKIYWEQLPPIKDSGEKEEMWVAYCQNKEVRFFWDCEPQKTDEIKEIIRVGFDSESFMIRDLTSQTFGRVEFVLSDIQREKRIYVGYRMPFKMRPPEPRN